MPLRIFNQGLHTGNWEVENKAQKLVTLLIENDNNIWYELLNIEIFSALFCKRNETFLEAMRWCFRDKLVNLCNELNQSKEPFIEQEKKVNRHICTLPLAGIKTGQKYLIPTYNTKIQQWELITYKVAPIELTPTYGIGRLVLTDNNRLFAYGFTPMTEDKVVEFNPQPHLVFVSPEYPAQQGFLANLYLWFQSVSRFYKYCQPQIDHWLNESTKHTKTKAIVHAIGHASRLALETAFTESAQYIAKESISDAFSLPHSIITNYQSKWETQKNKPEVSVQMHKKHYNFGEVLPKWSVYTSEGNKIEDYIFKEYFKTLVASNILSSIANALLIMPCQYFFIPVIRAILNHKTELALLSILIMVFWLLPGLVTTEIGTTLAIFTAVYFGFKLIEPIKVLFNVHEKAEAACHITSHTEENDDEEYRWNIAQSNYI